MIRIALIVSIAAHLAWGYAFYQQAMELNTLLAWACENGNGGHECGEE